MQRRHRSRPDDRPARTAVALLVACAFVGLAALVTPRPAGAQGVAPALLGTAGGLVSGGFVSVGLWTARARFDDHYLFSARDALAWESLPVAVGALTGLALGLADRDRLRRTGIGAGIGFFVGSGIGLMLGTEAWVQPEGGWAGGVIGGAAGLVLGSVVGMAWPGDGDGSSPGDLDALRSESIPLGITIRFR